jgi:hypothetical protein
MKLKAHFFLLNDDFSPEYAEANHAGKESENNPLYEWEDELEVSNGLLEVSIERQATYTLKGEMDGGPFSFDLPNMFVVNLKMKDGVDEQLTVSESILDSYDFIESSEEKTLKVYIKDFEPLANPIAGVYIASQEFPTALIPEC